MAYPRDRHVSRFIWVHLNWVSIDKGLNMESEMHTPSMACIHIEAKTSHETRMVIIT
jgi:hypothetical protein